MSSPSYNPTAVPVDPVAASVPILPAPLRLGHHSAVYFSALLLHTCSFTRSAATTGPSLVLFLSAAATGSLLTSPCSG
jgi:hypothetical protein